jgi:hypothetical protein
MYYLPNSVEMIDLDHKVVFYHREDYIDIDGPELPLVKEALPALRDGTTIDGLVDRTSLDTGQATELIQLLTDCEVVVEVGEIADASGDVSADQYHLEARTDPEFAAEALDRLEATPIIAVPQGLSDIVDVEYDWPVVPHKEVVTNDVEACLASITYHDSPNRNLRYQEAAEEHDFYFLPLRLYHTEFILGPVFSPGRTVGFESAYKRERANGEDPVRRSQIDEELEDNVAFPLTEEMKSLVSGVLVSELKKLFTKYYKPNTVNQTITVKFETLQATRKSVLRVPKGER